MNKRIIIISIVILMVITIIGLYQTFASDAAQSNDNVFNIALVGSDNTTITVPAKSSKTIFYKISSTNKGKVKYGVAYTSDNIMAKEYYDTIDPVTGLIDYGDNKFIKLILINDSDNEDTVTISTVLGYEKGGNLIPANKVILVTEKYEKEETIENYTVTFDYLGGTSSNLYTSPGQETYTVPSNGSYKLEAWGAQGGNGNARPGGHGGYATGTINLSADEKLYLYVGGRGEDGDDAKKTTVGGYNGGGKGYCTADYFVGGGGGASDIRYFSSTPSTDDLEWNSSAGLNARILVAGGGGGSAYLSSTARTYQVGCGGGYIGRTSTGKTASETDTTADGGTQSAAGTKGTNKGTFGTGANGTSSGQPGGGGGWYGGNTIAYAAGGGSGYIGSSLLSDKYMYCYGCSTSSDTDTLTYSTEDVSTSPISNYAKDDDGAIRITQLTAEETYGSTYGTLPTPTKSGYTFVGWNTESDGSGTMITSSTKVSVASNHTLYAIWDTYADGKSDCFTVTDKTYKPDSNWRITLNICWKEQYKESTNTSKVSITDIQAKIVSNYGFTYYLGGDEAESSTSMGIYINDTRLVPMSNYTGGYRVYFGANNSFASITSKTAFPWTSGEITHNSDGTLTVPIRVYLKAVRQTESSSYYSTFDTTTNITLTDTVA